MKKWSHHIQFYTVGWFFAAIFFYIVRQVGVKGVNGLNITFQHFLLFPPFFAIIPGIIFGSLQYFFEQQFHRKLALPMHLLRMLVVQLVAISLFSFIFTVVMYEGDFRDLLFSKSIFVFNFYIFLINLLLAFLVEIINLIGRGNFLKLITGKFFSPKEEYRIFLFIDLKSSTTIAEKLGHIAYSQFMQDCYRDLDIVGKFNTEIYQYVGDEVVFTWDKKKVTSLKTCIDAFWHIAIS